MKKILAILLIVCMLATALAACGNKGKNKSKRSDVPDRESVGLEFELNEDESGYTVVGIGTCKDTALVIPKTYNGLPVTSIGPDAFYYCDRLTSINYGGTKAQWSAIPKGSYWDLNTGSYTVTCTDGVLTKAKG